MYFHIFLQSWKLPYAYGNSLPLDSSLDPPLYKYFSSIFETASVVETTSEHVYIRYIL